MPKYFKALLNLIRLRSLNQFYFVRWCQGGQWVKLEDAWHSAELIALANKVDHSIQRYFRIEYSRGTSSGMMHETFVGIQAIEDHD